MTIPPSASLPAPDHAQEGTPPMYHVPAPSSPFFRDPEPEPEKVDITGSARDRARAEGLRLPKRYTVWAWLSRDDDGTPYDKGDVYHTDVDEADYDNPTRAFCKHCGAWIRELAADAVAGVGPDADGREPEPGDWADLVTGIDCPGSDDRLHKPDEPLAVRWWREDKWTFTIVHVQISDRHDQECGYASLGSVEVGTFPHKIDLDTGEVESIELDPLSGGYPLPDLIDEALHDMRGRRRHWIRKVLPWL